MLPEPGGDLRQADLDPAQELDVGDQQEVHERGPYLRHHCVLACPKEGLDPEVLFDPLEEQLDLPSLPVDRGDCRGGQPEVVRQEDEIPVALHVVEHHAPQSSGIRLAGVRELRFHHFVGDDAQPFVRREVLSGDLQPRVPLEPCHEEGPLVVDLLEPCVVAVALVVGVDAVRLDAEPLPRRLDVGHLPVAHDDEARQVAGEIQLRVQLDRSLVRAVARPVVRVQGHRDGRAVNGEERVVEAEAVPGGELFASGEQFVEQLAEHGRGAAVHRVGECRSGDRLHAQVIEP